MTNQVAHDVPSTVGKAPCSCSGGPSIRPAPARTEHARGQPTRLEWPLILAGDRRGAIPVQFRAFVAEKVDERVEPGV